MRNVPRRWLPLTPALVMSMTGCFWAFEPNPNPRLGESDEEDPLTLEVNSYLSAPPALGVTKSYDLDVDGDFDGPEAEIQSFSLSVESDSVEIVSKSDGKPSAVTPPEFELRGDAPGPHSVSITAELQRGESLENTLSFRPRRIHRIRFESASVFQRGDDRNSDETSIPFLTDSVASIDLTFVGPDGETLLNDGLVPVESSPRGALEWAPSDSERQRGPSTKRRFLFDTRNQPGIVTLQSKRTSDAHRVRLIDVSMVQGLRLVERPLLPADGHLELRGRYGVHFVPVYRGIPIYDASIDVTLTSGNPDVCKVVSDDGEDYEERTGDAVTNLIDDIPGGFYVVDLRKAGECPLRAEFPPARGGSGVEWKETFHIR